MTSKVKKRPYNTAGRRATSEKTKGLILSAAQKLFKEHGFDVVTIDEIAIKAGVSAPTVYSKFKSKKGILADIIDAALPADTHETLVEEIYSEKSAEKQLQLTAKLSRRLYEAEYHHMDWARGASVIDPVFKELENEREKRRHERQKKSVDLLYEKAAVRRSLPKAKAKDILWVLTGRDFYRMLVIERKWSNNEYEEWLANILIREILS